MKYLSITLLILVLFTNHLKAQNPENDVYFKEKVLDEVTITVNRIPEIKNQSASTVQIINKTEIAKLVSIYNGDLSKILGMAIQGMAMSSNTVSNRSQTLRGLPVLMLIDGIPQSTPLRTTDRDLRSIDPAVIDRIEIVKGATSIYSNGAIGGVINIITKRPDQNKEISGTTTISVSDYKLIDKKNKGTGYKLNQLLSGTKNKLSYTLFLDITKTGSAIDGDGEFISPRYGLGDNISHNILAKLSYKLNDKNTIEWMFNNYASIQKTDLILQKGKYLETPSIGIYGEQYNDAKPEGTPHNNNSYIKYNSKDIFKHTDAQFSIFYQDIYTVYDYRVHNPKKPRWEETSGQATIKGEKLGARAWFNSKFFINENIHANISYGLDYLLDKTSQPLVDKRIWVPELKANNLAAYLQTKFIINNSHIIKLGSRFDYINVNVPDFNILRVRKTDPEVKVKGGNLDYNNLSFNAAYSFIKFEELTPYLSFSQGFNIFDLGRVLRDAKEDVLSKIDVKPVLTNHLELGIMSKPVNFLALNGSIFGSFTNYGSELTDGGNGFWVVSRSPQRIYGFELEAQVDINKYASVRLGYVYFEGKKKEENSDSYDKYLSGLNISPSRFTTDLIVYPFRNFDSKISLVHSGSRSKFNPSDDGKTYKEGEGPVKSFSLINISSSYKRKNVTYCLGIENFLNKTYFTPLAMSNARDNEYTHGNGRYVSISAKLDF